MGFTEDNLSADEQGTEETPPRVFMSYSWGGTEHQAWVAMLAARLLGDGVDVTLDQWDTTVGAPLQEFMQGLRAADRIIVVATPAYIERSARPGTGVFDETRLIQGNCADRVIPILRQGDGLPDYLGSAKYIDFRDDDSLDESYVSLARVLHNIPDLPKPALGRNPFTGVHSYETEILLREKSTKYQAVLTSGSIEFDYENNDGHFTIGADDCSFTIRFSAKNTGAIYCIRTSALKRIALAASATSGEDIGDASRYETSSATRPAVVGDALLMQNIHGYWAAIFIEEVALRGRNGATQDLLRARYQIQRLRSPIFS